MEDLNKLPKWARDKILRLQSKLINLEEDLKEFRGEKDTNIFRINLLEKHPLPKGQTIQFDLIKNKYKCKVDIRVDRFNNLLINTDSSLQTIISPEASNSFKIQFIEYEK